MNTYFAATHDKNAELAAQVVELANHKNVAVRHNHTASRRGGFDGWHRYIIFNTPDPKNIACTSREVDIYWEARYAHYFKPSIVEEAACLRSMIHYLTEKQA